MFYRKFNTIIQDVIIVGCGGTGSRIIAPLIQTIKQARSSIDPCIYLVDGDIVEEKNLTRQNFIKPDVGRNKAIVLAERYSQAMDFPVVSVPEMVMPNGSMAQRINASCRSQGRRTLTGARRIVIMCVDSIDARLNILKSISSKDIIIDAGNEDTYGQVNIFDAVHVSQINLNESPVKIPTIVGDYELPFIPSPLEEYLHARANPPVATGSCADLDQSLAINNMMAAGIINFFQNITFNSKFTVATNRFDLLQGNSSDMMTSAWLESKYNQKTKYLEISLGSMAESSLYAYSNSFKLKDFLSSYVGKVERECKIIDPKLLAAINGR